MTDKQIIISVSAVGVIALVVGILIVMSPAGTRPGSDTAESLTNTRQVANDSTPPSPQTTIPEDITYPTIDVEEAIPYKRSVDVRISRRVNENELKAIAETIKNKYPSDCNRTFIFYFLPGTVVGTDVCWATSHFEPDLDVQINGGSADEEKRVSQAASDETGTNIGQWLDAQSGMGICRIRIYTVGSQSFMERRYGDGSKGVDPMMENDSPEGKRFTYAAENFRDGDYVLIDIAGNLEFRNNNRLQHSAEPVK